MRELHIPQIPKVETIKGLAPFETYQVNIPICCKEGWEDCPHVVKKEKKKRVNIGL